MGGWEPNSMRMPDGEQARWPFPADFSAEEADFAAELRDLFPLECEELPPLYVSTLASGEHYAPLVPGYEHKVSYRVFRQLRLPRVPLFGDGRGKPGWMSWSTLRDTIAQTSRPLLGAMGAAMLLMVLTVVLASPSFAAGVRLIFGQTGAMPVQSYPRHVSAPASELPGPTAAPQPFSMQLSWLGQSAGQFSYEGLLQLPAQSWSAGPIADMQYTVNGSTNGSGVLDIREFQLASSCSAVLQVVQDGYAQQTQLGDGTSAVFVDGAWAATDTGHTWQTGEQNKLLFERNGVLFWITGDPRDGLDENALVTVANELVLTTSPLPVLGQPEVGALARDLAASMQAFYSGELYYVVPTGITADSGVGSFVLMQGSSVPSLD